MIKATYVASVQCTHDVPPLVTKTITMTTRYTETQTTTVSSNSTYTVVVTESPSEDVLSQNLESTGSQAAWTVVAIIFTVTTGLSVTLVIILGYLLYKRTQMMNELNSTSSGQNLSKPLPTCKSSIRYETLANVFKGMQFWTIF